MAKMIWVYGKKPMVRMISLNIHQPSRLQKKSRREVTKFMYLELLSKIVRFMNNLRVNMGH